MTMMMIDDLWELQSHSGRLGWVAWVVWLVGLFMKLLGGLESHRAMYVGLLIITIPWAERGKMGRGSRIFYGYMTNMETISVLARGMN